MGPAEIPNPARTLSLSLSLSLALSLSLSRSRSPDLWLPPTCTEHPGTAVALFAHWNQLLREIEPTKNLHLRPDPRPRPPLGSPGTLLALKCPPGQALATTAALGNTPRSFEDLPSQIAEKGPSRWGTGTSRRDRWPQCDRSPPPRETQSELLILGLSCARSRTEARTM